MNVIYIYIFAEGLKMLFQTHCQLISQVSQTLMHVLALLNALEEYEHSNLLSAQNKCPTCAV